MIIILGPDHTGKTTLAKSFDLPYYHFTKDSTYLDYLKPLVELKLFDAVLDRHMFCENPYSAMMNRKFQYTTKEYHNIMLLTLIQNPLVILCTHKPTASEYSSDQYLPYHKWDGCLSLYRRLLHFHHIPYLEYDYTVGVHPSAFATIEAKFRGQMQWWAPMWKEGYGCIGSPKPKVLLVAERIGPNNVNNLPFETGPTGLMLSEMLATTGTPLSNVAVTNLVKSYRRDPRPPNEKDIELLRVEVENLKPEKIVFMGTPAKQGIQVANEFGIPYERIVHLGYYHYKKVTDMGAYHAQWRRIIGMMPKLPLGE